MNPIEQFEAEVTAGDPYAPLHDQLAVNDDRMLEELVAMRKRKGLSQDTVAKRMNRSKTAVSNFERLGADPHLSTIRRYAAAVGAEIRSRVCDFDEQRFDIADAQMSVRVAYRKAHWRCEYDVSDAAALGPWAPA